MKNQLKKLAFFLQGTVGTMPAVYLPLYRALGKNRRLLVDENTQIVIEGFPRSGNTFSVVAFEFAQENDVNIAHHLHAAAQITSAASRNIPAVALIRNPIDAVASLSIREPHISIGAGLKEYVRFYSAVLPYKDRVLTITFEQVITDFGKCIEDINEKFGTDFCVFEHTEENVEKVFDLVQSYAIKESPDNVLDEKKVARPSSDRKEQAKRLKKTLKSKKYSDLLARAESLYKELVNASSQAAKGG